LSLGPRAEGDARSRLSDDVPAQNRGDVPRHAKIHSDCAAAADRLTGMRAAVENGHTATALAGPMPPGRL
jgi:hypothetical protein